jgi:hypothetical protein
MCDIKRSIATVARFGSAIIDARPRDSHDLRLIRTILNFSPAASVRWIHDVFGNSIRAVLGISRAAFSVRRFLGRTA